ncbi:Rv3235 family protein [Actinoplanes missouriensis]|uniref:Rv3235 family protein n=1 Tax=Actinoplanes missouriensis TaxID=1866 RepID=UPI0033F332B6
MRTTIHLRPLPRYEPPFDDELAPQVWSPPRQQLALDWSTPAPVPARPDGRPDGRPEGDRAGGQPVGRSAGRPAAEVPGASGDAKLAVRRFVHLSVEVLNGFRPAGHLRRLSLPSHAADVVAAGLAGAQWVGQLRRAKKTRRPAPVAVLKVHLCEPRAGAVEAAVVLVTGERTWALALRMELHQQTWLATALRLI